MTNEEILAKTKEEIRLRGLSSKTEELYLKNIEFFIKHYKNRPLLEMSETEIREFLIYMTEERKISSSTVNVYNCALRFAFGAILERNLNYQMIPRRRIRRELPKIMSKSEIARFFSVIDNLRDKAMFMTVYGGGLRLSEVIRLRVQDIDSVGMRIFVYQGKGGKDRYTLLSTANLDILRVYWSTYKPEHPEGFMFYPKYAKHRILHGHSVGETMKKYLLKAGLPLDYSIRTLRHCFATHLLESGVDVTRIKQLMGHTHIQSTTFYLHLLNFDGSIQSPLDSLEVDANA